MPKKFFLPDRDVAEEWLSVLHGPQTSMSGALDIVHWYKPIELVLEPVNLPLFA
jgi:hypothetical protein